MNICSYPYWLFQYEHWSDTEHQIKWEEHPVFLDNTPTQPTAINCDISQLNFAELASDWS